ncbi:MAG: DUF6029 family protein [bacterium]
MYALADPVTTTGSFYFKSSGDKLSITRKTEEELLLTFLSGNYTGFLRVDNYAPFPNQTRDMKLGEGFLNYAKQNWELRGGDFTQIFGNGIILSSYRFKELSVDKTLRGARVERQFNKGSVLLLGGQGKGRQEDDEVFGARAQYEVLRDLHAGVNFVNAKEPTAASTPEYRMAGLDASFKRRRFDALAEYDTLRRTGGGGRNGHSFYGNLNLYLLKKISFFGAYVTYVNMNQNYALGPTLKSNFEVVNYDDERGHQMGFLFTPSRLMEVKYSHNWLNNRAHTFAYHENEVTVRAFPKGRFSDVFFYFRDKNDPADSEKDLEIDAQYKISPLLSATMQIYGEDHTPAFQRYKVRSATLGFLWGGEAFVGYTQQRSTRKSEPQRDWGYVNSSYNLTPVTRLELLMGSDRGGRVCTSGVCVIRPPLDGALFQMTHTF